MSPLVNGEQGSNRCGLTGFHLGEQPVAEGLQSREVYALGSIDHVVGQVRIALGFWKQAHQSACGHVIMGHDAARERDAMAIDGRL